MGAGPSGFYAAEALLRSSFPCEVTVIERLPILLMAWCGAALHLTIQKLKQTAAVFERIAQLEGFDFVGSVEVGRTISIFEDVLSTHHSVILAYGASEDQRMGIPGEELPGSYAAREFVGWYNGHPDYRECHFDLSGEVAVIIGQGNVALDVARNSSRWMPSARRTFRVAHGGSRGKPHKGHLYCRSPRTRRSEVRICGTAGVWAASPLYSYCQRI